MRPWRLADPADYLKLGLRAHELLAGIPLHDVWQVDLPAGGDDRTIVDVRALMRSAEVRAVNPLVRALFALRAFAGRILRWDRPVPGAESWSFLHRLSDDDRRRSLEPPGSGDGPFTLLYAHPHEALSEIRNATVHAFLVFALTATEEGYRLHWAIYVEPVGRATKVYMALIDPFRRRLVYPAILGRLHRAWTGKYAAPRIASTEDE